MRRDKLEFLSDAPHYAPEHFAVRDVFTLLSARFGLCMQFQDLSIAQGKAVSSQNGLDGID
ncbi:MAG: hypothetical protein QGG34_17755, partial [SAR202 cluster bacterium]|nr:hypothetical protein [SAR202 cluster bacterium]